MPASDRHEIILGIPAWCACSRPEEGQVRRDTAGEDPVHAEEGGLGQLRPGQEGSQGRQKEMVQRGQGLRYGR